MDLTRRTFLKSAASLACLSIIKAPGIPALPQRKAASMPVFVGRRSPFVLDNFGIHMRLPPPIEPLRRWAEAKLGDAALGGDVQAAMVLHDVIGG